MRSSKQLIKCVDVGIAGAEADLLLQERDYILHQAQEHLAPSDVGSCTACVAIVREDGLVFGYCFRASALPAQQLTFGKMRNVGTGR